MKKLLCLLLSIFGVMCASSPTSAKRAAPVEIVPIEINGYEYSQKRKISTETEAYGVYIVAKDIKTGEIIRETLLYTKLLDTSLEQDVQDIWLKSLEFKDMKLVAVDEQNNSYEIDIVTGKLIKPKAARVYNKRFF